MVQQQQTIIKDSTTNLDKVSASNNRRLIIGVISDNRMSIDAIESYQENLCHHLQKLVLHGLKSYIIYFSTLTLH